MGFLQDIREELVGLNPSKGALRRFGLTLGLAAAGIGILGWYKQEVWGVWVGVVGAGIGLWAVVWPQGLKWAYKPWMGLAMAMGWVVSRIILTVLFYLVLTPIGLIMRLSRGDPMERKFREGSYWIERAQEPYEPRRSEKMY